MNPTEYFKERFNQLQTVNGSNGLDALRKSAFNSFDKMGIPSVKHEEWKYTRISSLFNKEYQFNTNISSLSAEDIDSVRLPGHSQANELIFINGFFSPSLSTIRSAQLIVLPLEDAATNEYKQIVLKHLGNSGKYLKDGINALNTAFVHGGVFIHVKAGQIVEHPVYIYNITNAVSENIFSQPAALYISVKIHKYK